MARAAPGHQECDAYCVIVAGLSESGVSTFAPRPRNTNRGALPLHRFSFEIVIGGTPGTPDSENPATFIMCVSHLPSSSSLSSLFPPFPVP